MIFPSGSLFPVLDDILIMVVKSSSTGVFTFWLLSTACSDTRHALSPYEGDPFLSVLNGLWDRELPSKGLTFCKSHLELSIGYDKL